MFTNQQTFSLVRNHLLKQGEKALDDNLYCCYLTPDGLKCAAGCLIPEGKYDPSFERREVDRVVIENGFSDWFGHNVNLMKDLQYIHDCCSPYEWDQQLRDLAERWGVSIEVS